MENKIIKSGNCLTEGQKEAKEETGEDIDINYILTDDGILTISGNTNLYPVPAPDAEPYYDEPVGPPCGWSKYVSQFRDLDFHTVIIKEGVRVLEEECFKDCKNFRKIVLPDKMPVIRSNFAEGSPLEYTEKDGLLFLGTASNPLYYLMGSKEDFDKETLIIPEGTVMIANDAFRAKKCIKKLVFPASLEFAGWYTFDGTTVKDVFFTDGKLAFDETIIAFEGGRDIQIESVSFPYSVYTGYKEDKEDNEGLLIDAFNSSAKIIFRNPDGSIAEILEPKPEPENRKPAPDDSDDDWVNSFLNG